MAEIGSVIGEKYEIVQQIGKGGMSKVYLALDRHLQKRWALKEIQKSGGGEEDGAAENSLLMEAEIMKRLDHPALPRIVDIFEDARYIWIVMDFVEGQSLDQLLAQQGPQPEETVLEWAKQICGALMYLHSRKPPIIYRDMKPANVMLGPQGDIRIIDFGIAREYKAQNRSDTTVLGTRGYASPEHYGARQTDARSDIYSLGMTLHHLLTGVNPRAPGYLYRPLRYWNPQLSAGMEAVIDRCTSLDPSDRYPDCSALMSDLIHIRHLTANHQKKMRIRLRIFWATAALAVCLLTAGFSLRATEARIVTDRYDSLVSVIPSLSLDEKLKRYEEAVRLCPDDTKAYLRMVEALTEEGTFNREQSDSFLSLYNACRGSLDWTCAAAAELNYRIGILYFSCYADDDGGSFSARVQKAYPFFAENHENTGLAEDFADRDLCECYYQICNFYRTYVLSPADGREAVRETYLALIAALDESVDCVLGESAYDQLSLYNGAFLLLYDQRENMASLGVDEEAVFHLMDRVHARTVLLTVQKKESTALKNEIVDHYRTYREAIGRAYRNEEEKRDV